MKKLVMTLSMILAGQSAMAIHPSGTTATISGALFAATKGDDNKIIVESREDAAMFVATEGVNRGVRLIQALELVRSQSPNLRASDMEIAQAILSAK